MFHLTTDFAWVDIDQVLLVHLLLLLILCLSLLVRLHRPRKLLDTASANRHLGPGTNSVVLDSGMGHFSWQSLSPTPLASTDASLPSRLTRSVSPTGSDSSSSTVVLDDKHPS